MKNLLTGIAVIISIACAVLLFLQHQAQDKLRAEDELLRRQIAQLKTENDNLSKQLAAIGDCKRLSDAQLNELLKLRGEVGMLRQQTNALGKMRQENQQLQAVQRDTQPQQASVDAQEQQRQVTMLKLSTAKQGMLAFVMFADDNQDQYPTNFSQVATFFNNGFADQIATNFDISYQGSITNIAHPADTIVLKEKLAWQALNGKWMKTYGFADGHAEVHTEANGNFDDWESQRTVSPQPNQ